MMKITLYLRNERKLMTYREPDYSIADFTLERRWRRRTHAPGSSRLLVLEIVIEVSPLAQVLSLLLLHLLTPVHWW